MDWRLKAGVQSVFSSLPGGYHMNFAFQKWVSRAWPLADEKLREIVSEARRNAELLNRHVGTRLSDARLFEFGAGADLSMALASYSLGAETQTLVDIRSLARRSLVESTISSLRRLQPEFSLERTPSDLEPGGVPKVLLQGLGIRYLAPCDARATGLPEGSFDSVASTNTLEHIPPPHILSILKESRRLVGRHGVIISQIDYQDHYSYFDGTISAYNFLRYSDSAWRKYSPSIQYQNRMRHRDYLQLFLEAGLVILEDNPARGSGDDVRLVQQLPVDDKFKAYSPEELTIRGSVIVATAEPI